MPRREKADQYCGFLLTRDQKERVESVADATGQSFGSVVRGALLQSKIIRPAKPLKPTNARMPAPKGSVQ